MKALQSEYRYTANLSSKPKFTYKKLTVSLPHFDTIELIPAVRNNLFIIIMFLTYKITHTHLSQSIKKPLSFILIFEVLTSTPGQPFFVNTL